MSDIGVMMPVTLLTWLRVTIFSGLRISIINKGNRFLYWRSFWRSSSLFSLPLSFTPIST